MSSRRVFAIVPGAGRSRRMGAPKLLLQVDGRPLIDGVLRSWCDSKVDAAVVVVRGDDSQLVERCRKFDVEVVATDSDPQEMCDSLLIGLQHVAEKFQPQATEAWMVAPADLPGLQPALIDAVLARYDPTQPRILAAAVGARRRHPVLLPWSEVAAFQDNSAEGGLDGFLSRRAALIELVEVSGQDSLDDVDTPADLSRWSEQN